MKTAIIGAGNMGGAVARGLAKGTIIPARDIILSDTDQGKLAQLTSEFPSMKVAKNNREAAAVAELVIVAVKPWLLCDVLKGLELEPSQMLLYIAAGISFKNIELFLDRKDLTIFRVIPNTAISEMESMTLIATRNANAEQQKLILDIFNQMGRAQLLPEDKFAAATSMTSCGIAYVLKYIQAAMQAGVEMGIYPGDAMKMVAQSVKGAAELILKNDTHPSVEIDKVCTPGGITIKGLNELEHEGFSSAIIKAMKKSL